MRTTTSKLTTILLALTFLLLAFPALALAATSTTDTTKALKVTYADSSVAYADSFDDLTDVTQGLGIGRTTKSGTPLIPQKVELQANLKVVRGYEIYATLTVDLAGHTLTAENDSVATNLFSVKKSPAYLSNATYADGTYTGSLTLEDSAGTGAIKAKGYEALLFCDENTTANVTSGTYVLSGGVLSDAKPEFVLSNKGTLTVTGGTFSCTDAAAREDETLGPGALLVAGGTASVKNATLKSAGLRSFSATATGGTLGIDESTYVYGKNGSVYVGKDSTVLLEYGVFDGRLAYHVGTVKNLTVNGGLFSDADFFASNVVAAGSKTSDGRYLVGTYTQLTPAQFVFSNTEGKVADGNPQVISVIPADGYSSSLVEGTNYQVSYEDNCDEGTATCVVMSKKTTGGFVGRVTCSYTIGDPTDLANATVVPISAQTYTGEPLKPAVIVTMGANTLKEGTDYTVELHNNTNVGTALVSVKGKGSYTGMATATFSVVPKSIELVTVDELGDEALRDGQIRPKPVVHDGKTLLVEDVDYTLSYAANNVLGSGMVTITGKGNYDTDTSVQAFFTIKNGEDFTKAQVTVGDGNPVAWTGKPLEPEVRVTGGGDVLVEGVDYKLSYLNNTDAGSATVKVTGIGAWVGEKEVPFVIKGTDILTCTFEFAHNPCPFSEGKIPDPGLSVKQIKASSEEGSAGSVTLTQTRVLKEGTEYTVTYDVADTYDQAAVTIKGIGEFEGTKQMVLKLTTGYTVIFVDGTFGTELSRQIVAAGQAADAPTAPEHDGVVFRGWDKDFSEVRSDLTVTALYSGADHHTVRFVDGITNELVSACLVEHGMAAEAPAAPTHEGYAYVGWSRAYDAVTTDLQVSARYVRATGSSAVVPSPTDNARGVLVSLPDGSASTYLTDSYGVASEGWKFLAGSWYYSDKEGLAKSGLQVIGKQSYVFDSLGVLQTGWITNPVTGKEVYAYPESGAIAAGSWFNDGTGWFLTDKAGAVKTGWQYDRGQWYWLPEAPGRGNGRMATGWIWDGANWYWCERSGEMRREWLCDDGSWYLLGNDGAMRRGWQHFKGSWYFLGKNGVMYANQWTTDGYWVDADGVWRG